MNDLVYENRMKKFFLEEMKVESMLAWGLHFPSYSGEENDCWHMLYMILESAKLIRDFDVDAAAEKLNLTVDKASDLFTYRLFASWLNYETEPNIESEDEIYDLIDELELISDRTTLSAFKSVDLQIAELGAHVLRIVMCSQMPIPERECQEFNLIDIEYIKRNINNEALLIWAQFQYDVSEAELISDNSALADLSLKWIDLCAKWDYFGDETDYVDLTVIGYESIGDKASAIRLIDQALEICSDKEQFLILKAKKLRYHGNTEAASKTGSELIELFPDSYTGYCLLTQSKWAENKTEEALALAEEGCRLFPDSLDCRINRAFVYFSSEKYEQALADFRISVDSRQYRYDSQRGIGRCLVLLGREIEAIEHFFSISKYYQDADIYFELADLYMSGGWIEDAARMCRKCLEIDGSFSGAYFHLASIADIKGNETEAIELYEKAISITPEHTAAMTSLALLLQQEGESERALELAEKALETTPDYADAMYAKGNILYYFGEYEEAEELFDQAISLIPDHVPALAGKGNSLVQMAEYDEAQISLDLALELDPDNLDACHGKLSLYRELGLEVEQQLWQKRIIMIENRIDAAGYEKGRASLPDLNTDLFEDNFDEESSEELF